MTSLASSARCRLQVMPTRFTPCCTRSTTPGQSSPTRWPAPTTSCVGASGDAGHETSTSGDVSRTGRGDVARNRGLRAARAHHRRRSLNSTHAFDPHPWGATHDSFFDLSEFPVFSEALGWVSRRRFRSFHSAPPCRRRGRGRRAASTDWNKIGTIARRCNRELCEFLGVWGFGRAGRAGGKGKGAGRVAVFVALPNEHASEAPPLARWPVRRVIVATR